MIHFNSSQNSGLDLGIADGNIAMLQWKQEESKLNYCSADFFNQLLTMLVSLQKEKILKGLFSRVRRMIVFFAIIIGRSSDRGIIIRSMKVNY